MGHKQISYISSGRVYKSDEIAEEEKVFERKDGLILKKKTSILKIKNIYI